MGESQGHKKQLTIRPYVQLTASEDVNSSHLMMSITRIVGRGPYHIVGGCQQLTLTEDIKGSHCRKRATSYIVGGRLQLSFDDVNNLHRGT